MRVGWFGGRCARRTRACAHGVSGWPLWSPTHRAKRRSMDGAPAVSSAWVRPCRWMADAGAGTSVESLALARHFVANCICQGSCHGNGFFSRGTVGQNARQVNSFRNPAAIDFYFRFDPQWFRHCEAPSKRWVRGDPWADVDVRGTAGLEGLQEKALFSEKSRRAYLRG